MDVDFLILADAAQEVNQKLYLLGGGWTIWNAAQYPSHATFAVALGLLVPWEETNERKQVAIVLVDPDGQALAQFQAELEVGRPPGISPGTPQRAILAATLHISLPRPGRYELRATGDLTESRSVSFEAILRAR